MVAPSPSLGPLSPPDFTAAVVAEFLTARPGLEVRTVGDLELVIGADFRWFLHNVYNRYLAAPEALEILVSQNIAASLESLDRPESALIDASRIVPVIKDRAWLEESRRAVLSRSGKTPEQVYEDYNEELVILYAEDTDHGIRYFPAEDLAKIGLEPSDLRQLAIANLPNLLPSMERHGENGIYMLSADGNYEASLILLNEMIWDAGVADVAGEIVVAIPTRDALLVTGSENPGGLEWMRQMTSRILSEAGAYTLTSKLFVYRNGKFEVFE